MTELTLIALMDVYDQCGKPTNFVPDYLDKREASENLSWNKRRGTYNWRDDYFKKFRCNNA